MNGVDYDRDAKQFRLKLITINQIVRNLILLFLSFYIYTYTCFFYDDAHVNSKKKKEEREEKRRKLFNFYGRRLVSERNCHESCWEAVEEGTGQRNGTVRASFPSRPSQ